MSDGNHSPGTHTGRRLAGDRTWHQAHHDQSTSSPSTAVAHDGHGASRVVDVGGRGSRTRTNLKNPSTTGGADSSPLQVHQRTRGPTTDGAARKWSATTMRSPSHDAIAVPHLQPPAPRISYHLLIHLLPQGSALLIFSLTSKKAPISPAPALY